MWYTIYDATQANIHAQATLAAVKTWVCDVCSIKATAVEGGEYIPIQTIG
jgi:hypothetical protein